MGWAKKSESTYDDDVDDMNEWTWISGHD